jgi:pimeloyl-ACP methyl ester carboxylesterase
MRAFQPISDGYVERDGVKVYYEVFGAGEPTVLLLPTWTLMHSRQWKMQVPYLARHCRVLTFDPRGNGRSDRPAELEAYAETEFAADAIAVMDATQTDRAIIVGFSLGVQRGLLLAANNPERVEAAVFIGPTYPGGGHPLPERAVYSWADELDSDEGWAKYNKHYWLRDYRGFRRLLPVDDVPRAALDQADRGWRWLGPGNHGRDARTHRRGPGGGRGR